MRGSGFGAGRPRLQGMSNSPISVHTPLTPSSQQQRKPAGECPDTLPDSPNPGGGGAPVPMPSPQFFLHSWASVSLPGLRLSLPQVHPRGGGGGGRREGRLPCVRMQPGAAGAHHQHRGLQGVGGPPGALCRLSPDCGPGALPGVSQEPRTPGIAFLWVLLPICLSLFGSLLCGRHTL